MHKKSFGHGTKILLFIPNLELLFGYAKLFRVLFPIMIRVLGAEARKTFYYCGKHGILLYYK